MMDDMADEFAEVDLTEAEVDAMMVAGTPVEVVTLPFLSSQRAEPYELVTGPPQTSGASSIVAGYSVVTVRPVSNTTTVSQTANLAG